MTQRPTIEQALRAAIHDLPDNWDIALCMGSDSWSAELYTPAFDSIADRSGDFESLPALLMELVSLAAAAVPGEGGT